MTNKAKNPKILSSVSNALRILKSFSGSKPTQRVSDLAISLGLAKSTVSRLLSTLAHEGFVEKDPQTGEYRLGLAVLTLGGIVTNNLEIHKETSPVMHDLVMETGETAHLAVLDGISTIYIHKEECSHPVRILTHLGRKNPAYCTGSGKVLLAYDENQLVDEVIKEGLIKYTDKSIASEEDLRRELKWVREQGYAVSTEELKEGTRSVAAPIRDYTGKVVASINVVGPIQRMKDYKMPDFARKVKQAGKEASERLGYDPRFLK